MTATEPEEGTPTTGPNLGLTLQLSRASMLALTRLQLAIRSGDRLQAMAAMDRLHALDAEMESLVARLPPPADNDTEWSAIARHVSDQKLAIAFEKLALVSDISGPDMVSASPGPPGAAIGAAGEMPPLPDWPALPAVEPADWRPPRRGLIAFVLAALVTLALAAIVALMISI